MWEFLKANPIPLVVAALTGSLAAYLLSLLVSHLRREKRWLGYSLSSRNIAERGHSKLVMKYGTRDIARLDSHTIRLRNIGNRPLVQLPIQIVCMADGEIVEHDLGIPDGATSTAFSDVVGRLVVTVDLLNPGEVIIVGLTVIDAKESLVKVLARSEFLDVKEIVEDADTEELLDILIILMSRLPFGNFIFNFYHFWRSKGRK